MIEILQPLGISTFYELVLTFMLILAPLLFISVYGWYLTKDPKVVFIAASSLIPLALVPLIITLLLSSYTELEADSSMKLGMAFAVLANLLNLSVLISKYASEIHSKNFDIDHVSRDHFASTLNTGAVCTIMVLAVTIFLPQQLQITMLISLVTIIVTLTVNHLTVRLFLREHDE